MSPVVPVVLLVALAAVEAAVLPQRVWVKTVWLFVVACAGVAAALLLQSQHQVAGASAAAAAEQRAAEVAALRGLWSQWDGISRALPPAGEAPAARFDNVEDALASLSVKVAGIDAQIAAFKSRKTWRSIDADNAANLAEFLRQHGSYRAVVSCPPGDVEAYAYANQLSNIMRAAGWDAHGPETTAGEEGAAMPVSLYVRNPASPEAAKLLADAFGRFNIPFQAAIAQSDAIPDEATVELYVPKKP
ncbi:MAG: hypothetical protein JO258_15380 [Alphaproteobacteria bacterium]|nr:hypothetical protein [Alphaproteobacteria bacterium]